MSALYVSVSCKSCSLSTSVLIILTFRRAASLHFDLRASVALQRPQRGRTTKPPRLWTPVLTEMCLNSSQTWRETDVTGQSKGKEVNDAFCAFSMRCLTTAERAAGRREAGCARWLVAYRNVVVCLLVIKGEAPLCSGDVKTTVDVAENYICTSSGHVTAHRTRRRWKRTGGGGVVTIKKFFNVTEVCLKRYFHFIQVLLTRAAMCAFVCCWLSPVMERRWTDWAMEGQMTGCLPRFLLLEALLTFICWIVCE